MTIPILNDEFERWFEKAVAFEKSFFSKERPRHIRGNNFFPTDPSVLEGWLQGIPYCCGIVELTSMNMPHIWCQGASMAIAENPELSLEDIQKMVIAWVLGKSDEILNKDDWWHKDEGENAPAPGIILYPYPVEDGTFTTFANILKEWGFTNLLSFPNPFHGGHKLDLLVCSTYPAGWAIKRGEIAWLDSLNTSPAQIVAPATT